MGTKPLLALIVLAGVLVAVRKSTGTMPGDLAAAGLTAEQIERLKRNSK